MLPMQTFNFEGLMCMQTSSMKLMHLKDYEWGLRPAFSSWILPPIGTPSKAVGVSIFHSKCFFFLKKVEYRAPNLMLEGVDANFSFPGEGFPKLLSSLG